MINFEILISSVTAPCKCLLIMNPHFFNSFSNRNFIVWLNGFFSQKFLNIIIVFKYSKATMILLFKSIAKYDKFIFLK